MREWRALTAPCSVLGMTDLPSDRLTRRWARGVFFTVGVACLVGATIALIDGHAAGAGAGAALGIAWIVAGKLMVRPD